VGQLLAGQARQRPHQEGVIRILENEADRHACRLLLAMGVVEEHLGELSQNPVGPGRICGGGQLQHES